VVESFGCFCPVCGGGQGVLIGISGLWRVVGGLCPFVVGR